MQFGYDQFEDAWFQEATATWMEERVYDAVNDNRQFLPASALALAGLSLDSPAGLPRVRQLDLLRVPQPNGSATTPS